MKHYPALLLAMLLLGTSLVRAELYVVDESADFEVEVLLSDLDNPTGLALRPTQAKRGPYQLFFAESGAGRVLSVSTGALEQVEEVIRDFPRGTLGQAPKYRVGPMGLAFLDRKKLTVGEQSPNRLSGYVLPEQAEALLVAADRSYSVGPLQESIAEEIEDLNFSGLAKADQAVFVTTGGQASQGWVLKATIEANRLAYLQPLIDIAKVSHWGAPGGIAVIPPPRPAFLVVALMGSREDPRDSQLAFFVPATGKLAMSLPTGLHDIVSLAYSPSGQLYAADFSWQEEQAGGVYRLDDARIEGRSACRAVKIASLVRPMSLAFAPDGSLFATALGAGENTKQGTLVKITGEL